QDNIVIASNNGFIQTRVGGIDALDGIALRMILLVEINLLEVSLQEVSGCIYPMHIVLVRRIGAPVSGRSIDFNSDQPMAVEAGRKDGVDLARRIAATANLNGDRFGRNQTGRV